MSFYKINYKGRVLIDLSGNTVSEDNLYHGEIAHDNKGNIIIGAAKTYSEGVEAGREATLEELPIMIQNHSEPMGDSEYYSADNSWLLEETNAYVLIENISENLNLVEIESGTALQWDGLFALSNINNNFDVSLICDINIDVFSSGGQNYLTTVFSTTVDLPCANATELNLNHVLEENTFLQELEGYTTTAKVKIIGIKWQM